ncbi:hypothetical protein BLNAU_7535 [Blattamonas nauphoetae]|uniref:Uncharacterized protein n=1 Tax=Blattamonas nauphoetae TaxID=2049346 RepID=A0ABQ9Y1M2_9EUKA|nr:hypothetical protein BLNAU_7535 [Blattamonas nauphoetae]
MEDGSWVAESEEETRISQPLRQNAATTHLSSSLSSSFVSDGVVFGTNCSPFLNWKEEDLESEQETVRIFQSLVATVKLQPALDVSLEAKAVNFLKSLDPKVQKSAEVFLNSHGRTTDESLTNFIQSIGVLISSTSQGITIAAVKILRLLISLCSPKVLLALVKADLIPQLIASLNPLILPFAEAVDIHLYLMKSINKSSWLATPYGLYGLKIQNQDEPQAVHETILKQVVAPSEKYLYYLCVNRFSIVDGEQSTELMTLIPRLLEMSLYYQPTMEIVLHMPVILTIPIVEAQRRWNMIRREYRQMGKTVLCMLRMEGFEDVSEERLLNDQDGSYARSIVTRSIDWSNLHGMNLLRRA